MYSCILEHYSWVVPDEKNMVDVEGEGGGGFEGKASRFSQEVKSRRKHCTISQ